MREEQKRYYYHLHFKNEISEAHEQAHYHALVTRRVRTPSDIKLQSPCFLFILDILGALRLVRQKPYFTSENLPSIICFDRAAPPAPSTRENRLLIT